VNSAGLDSWVSMTTLLTHTDNRSLVPETHKQRTLALLQTKVLLWRGVGCPL
jgi:hypothetical protein